ncbi:hypothetical protein KKF61_09170 [Patescibacteria group bacterium]|nr:hypothetical protein [Patescibacteria group bacterium]
MSNVTLATIREYVGHELGMWREHTTSAAGDAGGTYLTCATLPYLDRALADQFIKTTSGSTLVERKIQSNIYPAGMIHPYVVFGAQIATAVTFELWSFDPTMITQAINNAIRDLYPEYSKIIYDNWSLIGGNALPTACLDQWAATATPDWHTVVTATCAAGTTYIKHAATSLTMGTAAGTCYISSADWPDLFQLAGKSVDFYRLGWADTASNARLFVYDITIAAVATTTNDTYHAGGSNWELLKISRTLPKVTKPSATTDLAEVRFGMQTSTTDTAYWDKGYVPITGKTLYLLPDTIDQVLQVYTCNSWEQLYTTDHRRCEWEQRNVEGRQYLLIKNALDGYKIEVVGYGPYTKLSAETDTIDLDDDSVRALVKMTVANLFKQAANPLGAKDSVEAEAQADRFENEARVLATRSDKRPPRHLGKNM